MKRQYCWSACAFWEARQNAENVEVLTRSWNRIAADSLSRLIQMHCYSDAGLKWKRSHPVPWDRYHSMSCWFWRRCQLKAPLILMGETDGWNVLIFQRRGWLRAPHHDSDAETETDKRKPLIHHDFGSRGCADSHRCEAEADNDSEATKRCLYRRNSTRQKTLPGRYDSILETPRWSDSKWFLQCLKVIQKYSWKLQDLKLKSDSGTTDSWCARYWLIVCRWFPDTDAEASEAPHPEWWRTMRMCCWFWRRYLKLRHCWFWRRGWKLRRCWN